MTAYTQQHSSMEFFLNVFSEFAEFSDKKIVITAKVFEPQPPLV